MQVGVSNLHRLDFRQEGPDHLATGRSLRLESIGVHFERDWNGVGLNMASKRRMFVQNGDNGKGMPRWSGHDRASNIGHTARSQARHHGLHEKL